MGSTNMLFYMAHGPSRVSLSIVFSVVDHFFSSAGKEQFVGTYILIWLSTWNTAA